MFENVEYKNVAEDERHDNTREYIMEHDNATDTSTTTKASTNDDLSVDKSPTSTNGSSTIGVREEEMKDKRFENAISDIALAMSLIILPMVILSAVFIGVVHHLRLRVSSNASGGTLDPSSHSLSLINNSQSTDDAFFVDISSTSLLTIASWTSTVTSFLAPWIMALFSYQIASTFLKQQRQPLKLPTPYQLRLLIGLADGGYGSLWSWFIYRTSHRERKRGNSLVALSVLVFVFCTALGICIFLADTWLHLTTTTVQILENSVMTGDHLLLSRALSPDCTNSTLCTVVITANEHAVGQVANASEAYKTLFNLSTEHRVQSTSINGQVYSFYTAADIPSDLVYRGSTTAMATTCSPITKACNVAQLNLCSYYKCAANETALNYMPPVIFNCSSALNGTFGSMSSSSGVTLSNPAYYNTSGDLNLFLSYFSDSALTQFVQPTLANIDALDINQYFVTTQPAYFAVGAQVVADAPLYSDPEIFNDTFTGAASFLLRCSSQILQMNYTYSNGNLSDVVVEQAADKAIAAMTMPWFMPGNQVWDSMTVSMRQAALESTSQGLADSFARAYGHAMLSMGVGAMVATPTIQESTQHVRQITRMPKAPFFVLILLNCLYVLLGLVLGVLALSQKPRHVKPVQERLSVTGLVAALFEGGKAENRVTKMSQLFSENDEIVRKKLKVVMEPTEQGGWRYGAIES